MSHKFTSRKIQTKVKHEILREYMQTWGGIISHGLKNTYNSLLASKSNINFNSRLVYVDCFSSTGIYEEEGNKVYGSPIIGIKELDNLRNYMLNKHNLDINITIILAEKDDLKFEQLLSTLHDYGYSERIEREINVNKVGKDDIIVLKGDYRDHLNSILDFTSQQYTWSLYFLDPYGASGIDLNSVNQIVTQPKVDTIIYYPHLFIQRFSGMDLILSALDEKSHINHNHLKIITDMYGSNEWAGIAVTEHAGGTGEYVMPELVDLYFATLNNLESSLAVKLIPLLFEDKERVIYYLFLTTHDGTGALKINEILDSATLRQFEYRVEKRVTKSKQMNMFSTDFMVETRSDKPEIPEVDVKMLANLIYERFQSEKLEYRELLRNMAQSPYYVDDVRSAVLFLRRNKKAQFDGQLRHKTKIKFSQLS